ncbi:MAG: SurA N-terminal domain-containing protein [Spirochaetia bacterium]|nr:SurA N-terminal domain-containing protein [Spirochaetia bacterium]
MMQFLRKNAKIIMWIVLACFLITIFAVWGAQQSFNSKAGNQDVIANVGKSVITYTMLGEALQSKLQQLYDRGIKVTDEKEKQLKKELLDQLIERQLLLDFAKKSAITVSDEEVAQSITGIKTFNDENGRFSKERYLQYLYSQRINPDDFENEQRVNIIMAKLRNMIYAGVKMTDDELRSYYMKRSRRISVNYVYFNYKNFISSLNITEDQMKDYYALNKKNYEKPDRVRASHILIRPDASPTSPTGRTDEQAAKFAKDLLARVKAGEDFATLAKKYSQDPGSAVNGGDLDYFARGMMVPEFENAAFSMAAGQVSDVIKTQFGYHILKVTGKEAGFEPTYEKMRSKVLAEIQKEEGLKLMQEKAAAMKDAIKSPSDLERLAPANKVSVQSVTFDEDTDIAAFKSDEFKDGMLDMNKGDVSKVLAAENGYIIGKITSESWPAFNDADFKKKYDDLETRLRSIKFGQEYRDLIDRLKAEEKVVIFENNL